MSQTIVGQALTGVPPVTSYWIGVSRDELRRQIAGRRHQQAVPGARDAKYAPSSRFERLPDEKTDTAGEGLR